MSASFQERFKNRANFIGKQGQVEVESSYAISKPMNNQLFTPSVAYNYRAEISGSPMNSTSAEMPIRSLAINPPGPSTRKQTHSANPYKNIDIQTRSELKTSQAGKITEEYKPYTIQDYKNIKSDKYFELGGLGPSNIGSDDWKAKKEMNDKRLSYAKQVHIANANLPPSNLRRPPKEPEREISKVERAKQFARMIPKPVVKEKKAGSTPAMSSVLEELERQHLAYKASVDAIKSGFE